MATSSTAPAVRTSLVYPAFIYDLFRIMAGLLFLQHGLQKMFGFFGGFGGTPGGTAPFGTLVWVAGIIELVAGLLIALGLFTRAAAFIASGEMATAYFMAHFPRSFFPIQNGGEVVVLFCFAFLVLFITGAGPFSLDALLRRRGGAVATPVDLVGERAR